MVMSLVDGEGIVEMVFSSPLVTRSAGVMRNPLENEKPGLPARNTISKLILNIKA